jgi:PadR family transcriptional regulator PadR
MSPANPERLHGTLELLVLKLLEQGPMNGYAIGRRIQELTQNALIVEEGSLYPALYRMQRRGWLSAEWGTSPNNRRAKFYRLSRVGLRQLEAQAAEWSSFASAVERILGS